MALALFDLDNTLLDREAAFSRWSQSFIHDHELPEGAWPFMESADQDGMTPKEIFFEEVRAAFGISIDVEALRPATPWIIRLATRSTQRRW